MRYKERGGDSVAILMESSSSIELLLKTALQKEGLEFKEQQRIYERGNDLHPKYVADFVVTAQNLSIIVECDGASYHTSDLDVQRDIERDCWLRSRGYKKVLHFSAYQLRYEMKTVILTIKHHLGLISVPKKQLRFRGKAIRQEIIINVNDPTLKLHRVTLYYSYIQLRDRVWLVYKFKDSTLNRFSEERTKIFYNVPDKFGSQLAIYVALKDLKRSVELLVYCSSSWLTAYLNGLVEIKSEPQLLLEKTREELTKHNYLCKYINTHRDYDYYEAPSPERLVIHELQSRCRQLRYGKCKSPVYEEEVDFQQYQSSSIANR